ncbi:TetR family transcriptional regulator [Methylobacterium currus]|uniref:TetR family transcriptional regulator n=2 Tax=Methylobacterium currus TaxID=2051553 RepID=A0A2R4WMY5_9HYPH|nr:TetR family transcriptional regulator [Methylobacterium currus]
MAPTMSDASLSPPPADTDKRRQILDGAREVFLASGFDGASMGAIAKAAGVSKGTLYVYFESKEALFEALTIEEKRTLAENICRLDHDDPDVAAVLRRLGTSLMEAMVRPDHIASVRMVIGAAEKFPRFGRAFYEAGPLLGRARLRAYLDAQVDAGRLRPMDSDLAARHFFDLCAATTMRRLLFSVGDPPTEAETTYWIAEAVRVFLAAYGPEGR